MGLDNEVARLQRGDIDALSSLIVHYQHRLYRYLLRMVREPAEAEDLFQQTWLRVAEKIRKFDAQRNFDAWLFAVARNLAIDYLRRIRPESLDEPVSDDPSAGTAVERLVSPQPAPLASVLESERKSRVAAALEELPVVYREVVTLRFEEEMKLEEIAQVLAAPLSTVKSRLRRALGQMRHCLEEQVPGEIWS